MRPALIVVACLLWVFVSPLRAAGPMTGQGFGAERLGLDAVEGSIMLSAARAWMWRHPTEGGPHTTQRLALEGRVGLTLGYDQFEAERAVVWLQRIGTKTDADGVARAEYQVYVVLEDASTPAAASVSAISADRLPIQGVVSTSEPVRLRVDLRQPGPPPSGAIAALVAEAERRFADRLSVEYEQGPPPEPTQPSPALLPEPARIGSTIPERQPPPRPEPRPRYVEPDRTVTVGPGEVRPRISHPVPPPSPPVYTDALFSPSGVFSFSVGDRVIVQAGDQANAILLTGGVVAQYSDAGSNRSLELKAERAVVFLRPGSLVEQFTRFDAADLIGVYLEGEVLASDGAYTVRGPSAYYDIASSRTVIDNAVFYTYEQRTGMPLYLRADEVRQDSARQFSATNARLANTAFHDPHFTLTARKATVRVYDRDINDDRLGGRSAVDARNITLDAGGVPFLWLPGYKGDPEQFPLRDVGLSDSNRRGMGIRTTWNALSLLGRETPAGVSVEAQGDIYMDSGLGLGLSAEWATDRHRGSAFSYGLPADHGSDVTPNGRTIDAGGDARGYLRAQDYWTLSDRWTLRSEIGLVSDELLLENYFQREAEVGRELTNRLHLQRTDGNTLFTIEGRMQAHDFIVNQNILQAPGYFVDRLPSARFIQVAGDLLPSLRPGMLTHTWEASIDHMRFHFDETPASAYGYDTDPDALFALGVPSAGSTGDLFRSMGMNEDWVIRADTRHEFEASFKAGPVRINPFVVGRITAYDTDFEVFSPGSDDQVRLWGSGGVRLATELHKTNPNIDSRLLDLHQLRHIIEPSLTLWGAGSTVPRSALPVYDDEVEGLNDGVMVRVGIDQTWQTKRGGEGRWRSVDVLTLDAEYVYSNRRADAGDPIGRWYDARPELSNPGEFARVRAGWRATEIVTLAGETTYDFEAGASARSSLGLMMRHDPRFTTTAEYRRIDATDSTYGDLVVLYTLTDKYRARFSTTYNFDVSDFQNFSTRIDRAFPNGTLGISINYDNIKSETSFGFVFTPFGLRSGIGGSLGDGDLRFGG